MCSFANRVTILGYVANFSKNQTVELYQRRLERLSAWTMCLLLASLIIALFVICITTRGLLSIAEAIDNDLQHYRRNSFLGDYLDNIQILIEPSSPACKGPEEVPLVVLVTSAPYRVESRNVIRETYAKHQPTYFVLGFESDGVNEKLADVYLEAKEHSDIIVYDFHDHYQNLTLKTGLMMKWFMNCCPNAGFLLKTDDDVMVNPRVMRQVIQDNRGSQLIGSKEKNSYLHRSSFSKWYIPRWLYPQDVVEEYLEGPGYLINGAYVQKIYDAAHKVPLINLEDVFFTYLVAYKTLGLALTDDRRFVTRQSFTPLRVSNCAYFQLALVHDLEPGEMVYRWRKMDEIEKKYMVNEHVC